jgi:hypothetical protein
MHGVFSWLITGQTNVWLVVWNNNWSKKCDLTINTGTILVYMVYMVYTVDSIV